MYLLHLPLEYALVVGYLDALVRQQKHVPFIVKNIVQHLFASASGRKHFKCDLVRRDRLLASFGGLLLSQVLRLGLLVIFILAQQLMEI